MSPLAAATATAATIGSAANGASADGAARGTEQHLWVIGPAASPTESPGSRDDRYRGLKGLRTVVFMNEDDMRDRGLGEFDPVDITSFSKDGSRRAVHGYRAVRYEIPRGCAAGYMPELNVLCGIADYSTASGQPVTKHLEVEITPGSKDSP